MVLKLVGAGLSVCTMRAALVLVEKKVPFELVSIDMMKGEHKAPEFVSKQPFGQVPYMIDDDGFVLYESRAICRYIEEKYAGQGTPLVPTDPKGKALFEQAASIEFANFDPFASKAVFENVFKPMLGLTPDKAVFDTLISGLSAKLEVYEIILGKQKYLAGDEITLADLFHLPYGSLLKTAGSDIMSTAGPNVTRWFNDISQRQSWLSVKDGCKSVSSY
ncbi:glutathione S-transferase [Mycena belliarum]|uniref:glutathione transferase n=1 Tax=Mycena belliarum TaxID=1033014 RepID=A0AAD6XSV6_9AGAR|nr:glutathione S-transferase [Mycena belliae]